MKIPNIIVMSLDEYNFERIGKENLVRENKELKESLEELQVRYRDLAIKYASFVGYQVGYSLGLDSDLKIDVEKQKLSNDWLDERVKEKFKDIPNSYLTFAYAELKKSYEENKI